MKLFSGIFAASFAAVVLTGQTYTIQTVAGGGFVENIPAIYANLGQLSGVASDAAGNLYILAKCVVWRRDAATGNLTRFAGLGVPGDSGDGGPATSAQLNGSGIAVDATGAVYIVDSYKVRKVSGGIITTVAGNAREVSPVTTALP